MTTSPRSKTRKPARSEDRAARGDVPPPPVVARPPAPDPLAAVVAEVAATTEGPRTEGQRLLCAIPASAPEIGRAVGTSKQIVAYWRAGKKLPSVAIRAKIEQAYAIPAASWDAAPASAQAAAMSAAAATTATAPVVGRLERELAYIESLAHDDRLAASVRVRYQVELNKLIVEVERRDQRERERAEGLVTDPRVVRIITTVIEAVGPFGPALAAVESALLKLRAEEAS